MLHFGLTSQRMPRQYVRPQAGRHFLWPREELRRQERGGASVRRALSEAFVKWFIWVLQNQHHDAREQWVSPCVRHVPSITDCGIGFGWGLSFEQPQNRVQLGFGTWNRGLSCKTRKHGFRSFRSQILTVHVTQDLWCFRVSIPPPLVF